MANDKKQTGPKKDVIEHLVDVHNRNGTLDRIAESGTGEQIKEALPPPPLPPPLAQIAFLSANLTGGLGYELYSYDGVTLSLVAYTNPGRGSSYAFGFTVFNSDLYSNADDGTTGCELFKLDSVQS